MEVQVLPLQSKNGMTFNIICDTKVFHILVYVVVFQCGNFYRVAVLCKIVFSSDTFQPSIIVLRSPEKCGNIHPCHAMIAGPYALNAEILTYFSFEFGTHMFFAQERNAF